MSVEWLNQLISVQSEFLGKYFWVKTLHNLGWHDSFYRSEKLLHFVQPLHTDLPILDYNMFSWLFIFSVSYYFFVVLTNFIPLNLPPELTLRKLITQKRQEITSVGGGIKKREPLHTVGGNENWYSHYEKQYGGFLKFFKWNYQQSHSCFIWFRSSSCPSRTLKRGIKLISTLPLHPTPQKFLSWHSCL